MDDISRRTTLTTLVAAGLSVQSTNPATERTAKGPLIRNDDRFKTAVRLTRYGFRGDGRTDDSKAWRDAIEEATEANLATIIVPAGISIVERPIVDGKLPAGLTFEGEGRSNANEYDLGSRLRYVGDGTCWNIRYPDYQPASTGRWTFRGLTFQATSPSASMFAFNDPDRHDPVDGRGYSYLEQVHFEACTAFGAEGGRNQTGDFIKAAKVFQLTLDDACLIRGWRRGFWGKGCDNVRILARFFGNGRHVMLERSGTFANDALLASRFFGNVIRASEPGYHVWDNALGTLIVSPLMEHPTEVPGCEALMFLDGYGTRVVSPVLSGAPLFELGANARECMIDQPLVQTSDPRWQVKIRDPASWDFGFPQSDYRLRVANASLNARAMMGVHPRLDYMDCGRGPGQAVLATSGGLQRSPIVCHALDYWGVSEGQIGGKPIKGLIRDRDGSGGWAIRIDGDPGAGMSLPLRVGDDVARVRQRITCRARHANGFSGWAFTCTRNGRHVQSLTLPSSQGGQYATWTSEIDLDQWSAGDVATIIFYCTAPSAPITIDYVAVSPVAA